MSRRSQKPKTPQRSKTPPKKIIIEQLDVEQGDSALIIRFFEGKETDAYLIDGGYQSNYEEILKRLEFHKVSHVSKIILTHYDGDHLGGVQKIVQILGEEQSLNPNSLKYKIDNLFGKSVIYDPGQPFPIQKVPRGKTQQATEYVELCEGQMTRVCENVPVCEELLVGKDLFTDRGDFVPDEWDKKNREFALLCVCQNGYIFDGAGKLPRCIRDLKEASQNSKNLNDRGLGFVLFFQGHTFYTAGDISSDIEEHLSQALADAKITANIMKLSHHGSRHSTPTELVTQLKPEVILCSQGETNNYGHPHLDAVAKVLHAVTSDQDATIGRNQRERHQSRSSLHSSRLRSRSRGDSPFRTRSRGDSPFRTRSHNQAHRQTRSQTLNQKNFQFIIFTNRILRASCCFKDQNDQMVVENAFKGIKCIGQELDEPCIPACEEDEERRQARNSALIHTQGHLRVAGVNFSFASGVQTLKHGHIQICLEKIKNETRRVINQNENRRAKYVTLDSQNVKDLKICQPSLKPDDSLKIHLSELNNYEILKNLYFLSNSDVKLTENETNCEVKCLIDYDFGETEKTLSELKFVIDKQNFRLIKAFGKINNLQYESGENLNLQDMRKFILNCQIPPQSQERQEVLEEIRSLANKRNDLYLEAFLLLLQSDQVTITSTLKCVPFSYSRKNSKTLKFELSPQKISDSLTLKCICFIYKKNFEPGIGFSDSDQIDYKRYICSEFCEFKGELEFKDELSLKFSAVISDSPFVEFCMTAEGISLEKICSLLDISKDFDSLKNHLGFKNIELKGVFVTAEKSDDKSSFFKRVTAIGVRLHVIFDRCGFEVDSHFTLVPEKEIECSLTLLPGGKIHLLELLSKHEVPIDGSFNKDKDPVLTKLKICCNLPSKDLMLSFQVDNVFEFEIFERKLSCTHLKGEIIIADGTKSVHLQIAFLLGEGTAILDACYDDGDWSVSVDYVGDVELKDLKGLADKVDQIDNLNDQMIKSDKNYFSLKSFYLHLSRVNDNLCFAGSCLLNFGFTIPFVDAEVEGQGYLVLEKAEGASCKFTVIANEIKLNLKEINLEMTATLGVEWEGADAFRVYLADFKAETSKTLSKFCKEVGADLNFSDEIKKYPLQINKIEFCKTEVEWKMILDLQFGQIKLVSEVFKLRKQNSLETHYLFCGSIQSLSENLFKALKQDQVPQELLSAEATFVNIRVAFMKKIIFAFQTSLKVDFTILNLNDSDEGKVTIKELNCNFVRIQDFDKLELLAWKDKLDSSLAGQITELRELKRKWSLILDGEVEIFMMKCKVTISMMEGGNLVCKGQVIPKNFSLFEWLKSFGEEDDFKTVCESVKILSAQVEVYSKNKYVKFYCETSIGDVEIHLYKADGSNKPGVKVHLATDLIPLQDLPFPLDNVSFVYTNRENEALCIKKETALSGKLSFVKCEVVKPFFDCMKEVIPRFPTELTVGLNLKDKTLIVTEGIQWDLRLGDFLHMGIHSLEFKETGDVLIDAAIAFPIFNGLELSGRVSFDRSGRKIQGECGIKKLNLQFFKKLIINEAGINGAIYPISAGIGFFIKGTIQGYTGEFEVSVGPGAPLPFFNLLFPENFEVCLSTIVDVLLGVDIPKCFDFVKIKPRNGSNRIEVRLMSLIDIKAEFMLELFGFFQAEFYLEIGLQGIEAKIDLNKLSLLGGLIELTDSKTEGKGPSAHLCIKPFSKKYFFKVNCKIKLFGLEAAAFIDLGTEGLEVKIPIKLNLGRFLKIENEFHLMLKPGREIFLKNHFNFRLNISLPAFSIFELNFPEIKLFGSEVDFDLTLDTNKFLISGSFEFMFLGESSRQKFNQLELELCEMKELPVKVGLCLAKNIGKILLAIGEVLAKTLFNAMQQLFEKIGGGSFKNIGEVTLVFFEDVAESLILDAYSKVGSEKDKKKNFIIEAERQGLEEMKANNFYEAVMLYVAADDFFSDFKAENITSLNSALLLEAALHQWKENPNRVYCYLTVLESMVLHEKSREEYQKLSPEDREKNDRAMAYTKAYLGIMFLTRGLDWIAESVEDATISAYKYFIEAKEYDPSLFETHFGLFFLLQNEQQKRIVKENQFDLSRDEHFYANKCFELALQVAQKDHVPSFTLSLLNEFNYRLYSYALAHPFYFDKKLPNKLRQIILEKHKTLTEYNRLYGAWYHLKSEDIVEPEKVSKANGGLHSLEETKTMEENAKFRTLTHKEHEKANFKSYCLELAKKLTDENLKFEFRPLSASYILTQIQSMYFYAMACYQDKEYGDAQVWFEKILGEPEKIHDKWYMATNKQYDLKLNHYACTLSFYPIRKFSHYFLGCICLERCLKPSHHLQQDRKIGRIDNLCEECLSEAREHFTAAWEIEYKPLECLEEIDLPERITSLHPEKKDLKVICFSSDRPIRTQSIKELKESLERARNPQKNSFEKEIALTSSLLLEIKREYYLIKEFIELCREDYTLNSSSYIKDMVAILRLDAERRLICLINSNSSSAMWEFSQSFGNILTESEMLLLWKNSKHPEAKYQFEKNSNKGMMSGHESLARWRDALQGCLFGSLKTLKWDLNLSLSDKDLEHFCSEKLLEVNRQMKDVKDLGEIKKRVESFKELIEAMVDEYKIEIGKLVLDYFRQFEI